MSNPHYSSPLLLFLSCSPHLYQCTGPRPWCQQFLTHSLLQMMMRRMRMMSRMMMHVMAWSASWRLTRNAVCCHRRSCLCEISPVSEACGSKTVYKVISQRIITLPLGVTALWASAARSAQTNTHASVCPPHCSRCCSALAPHTSLHSYVPSLLSLPLICTNSTYRRIFFCFALAIAGCMGRSLLISPKSSQGQIAPPPPPLYSNPSFLYYHG